MMADERAASASRSGFGYRDFADFCRYMTEVFPVRCMVRGHDHVEAGWEAPQKYVGNPVLTLTASGFLNAFGMTYSTAPSAYWNTLALGVGTVDALTTVEEIAVPPNECDGIHAGFIQPSAGEKTASLSE